ncbi:MAG: hypothetical protein AB8F95_20990 [Bacteroidia bacterium]
MGEQTDIIVVGSGPAGAQACQTLVEKGWNVLLVDIGYQSAYKNELSASSFLDLREQDSQANHILGEQYEAVDWGKTQTGAQLTPARKHVVKDQEAYFPMDSSSFQPLETAAHGGLGAAWGAGSCVFSASELSRMGLEEGLLPEHYQTIADRIGLTTPDASIAPIMMHEVQPSEASITMDENHQTLWKRYEGKAGKLAQKGFHLGRPSLAAITSDRDGRKALAYDELAFYTDRDQSVYRPAMTIEALLAKTNFRYLSNCLVKRFDEDDSGASIEYINTENGARERVSAKRIMLAAGALGSARIVARSRSFFDQKIPLLSNDYAYYVCLMPSRLGKVNRANRLSLAQLSLFYPYQNPTDIPSMGSFYTYRSLMLFRSLKEVPLGFRTAIPLLQYLTPAMMIMGLHHPDEASPDKYFTLTKEDHPSKGDTAEFHYVQSTAEQAKIAQREKAVKRMLGKLGCFVLKKVKPTAGASIHYAGTIPYGDDSWGLASDGRLQGSRAIYVGDSAGFRFLPAKGLTLTIMANAHRTALAIHQSLTKA